MKPKKEFTLLLLSIGLFAACGDVASKDNTKYPYICSFGTPLSGITDTENTLKM